jgi:hypothetical protein
LKELEVKTSFHQKVFPLVANLTVNFEQQSEVNIVSTPEQVLFTSTVSEYGQQKKVQSDFFEIASSCKETEYSLNAHHKDLIAA